MGSQGTHTDGDGRPDGVGVFGDDQFCMISSFIVLICSLGVNAIMGCTIDVCFEDD